MHFKQDINVVDSGLGAHSGYNSWDYWCNYLDHLYYCCKHDPVLRTTEYPLAGYFQISYHAIHLLLFWELLHDDTMSQNGCWTRNPLHFVIMYALIMIISCYICWNSKASKVIKLFNIHCVYLITFIHWAQKETYPFFVVGISIML